MRPGDKYVEQAKALGLEMAERDSWIAPTFEDAYLKAGGQDYRDFRDHHRTCWEETNQFTILWLRRLEDKIVDPAAAEHDVSREGGAGDKQWEEWYYTFREPLLDVMWDAWETKQDMETKWREAYAKHKPKKKARK